MLGTILIVFLVLALVGALPTWPHSRSWGYYPTGGLGLVLTVVLILLLVGRLYNYCNILRDDGLLYQDYIELLTFLLFLKMTDMPPALVEVIWLSPCISPNCRSKGLSP